MKCRRIATLALLVTIIGGSFLSAAPVAGAESSVDKVEVKINGHSVPEGGLVVDGRTYMSVRQLQDSLRAFVYWDADNKRLYLTKPNVNMLLFRDKTIFGKVEAGSKVSFSVFTQVDSLKTEVDSIRLTITDPNGKTSKIQESPLTISQDNFWFRSDDYKYEFKHKGDYKIQCFLRQKNGEYALMSEMTVEAVDKIN
ncbi:stalk domain-containing protein [Paenibacillus marinisediminis]